MGLAPSTASTVCEETGPAGSPGPRRAASPVGEARPGAEQDSRIPTPRTLPRLLHQPWPSPASHRSVPASARSGRAPPRGTGGLCRGRSFSRASLLARARPGLSSRRWLIRGHRHVHFSHLGTHSRALGPPRSAAHPRAPGHQLPRRPGPGRSVMEPVPGPSTTAALPWSVCLPRALGCPHPPTRPDTRLRGSDATRQHLLWWRFVSQVCAKLCEQQPQALGPSPAVRWAPAQAAPFPVLRRTPRSAQPPHPARTLSVREPVGPAANSGGRHPAGSSGRALPAQGACTGAGAPRGWGRRGPRAMLGWKPHAPRAAETSGEGQPRPPVTGNTTVRLLAPDAV